MNFQNRYSEISSNLFSAIQKGDYNEQRKLANEYSILIELHHQSSSPLKIRNLDLSTNPTISIGEINFPIEILDIKGAGTLTIKDTFSIKLLSIKNFKSTHKCNINFQDCSFGKINIEQIDAPFLNLGLFGNDRFETNVNILFSQAKIRSLAFINSAINHFEFSSDIICKYFIVKNSRITCSVYNQLSKLKELRLIGFKNIVFTQQVDLGLTDQKFKPFIFFYNSKFEKGITTYYLQPHFLSPTIFKNCTANSFSLLKGTYSKLVLKHNIFNVVQIQSSIIKTLDLVSNHSRKILISHCEIDNCTLQTLEKSFLNFSVNVVNHYAIFDNSIFQDAVFTNTNFKSFLSARNSVFLSAPNFLNTVFPHSTSFSGSVFKDIKSKEAEGNYRILKEYMKKIHNEPDEILFSSYELESRRKDLLKNDKIEYIFSWLYFICNRYGRSIIQPMICMVAIWVLFALIFYTTDSFFIETKVIHQEFSTQKLSEDNNQKTFLITKKTWQENASIQSKRSQAIIFSSINMLGPLRLVSFFEGFKLTSFRYVLLTWSQSILATILWYLFMTGIKRRFKTL